MGDSGRVTLAARTGLMVVLCFAILVIVVVGFLHQDPGPWQWEGQLLLELAAVASIPPGVLILLRGTWHPTGWLLLWISLSNAVSYNSDLFSDPGSAPLYWLNDWWMSASFLAALATLVLFFPSGLDDRTPAWRRANRALLAVTWVPVVLGMVVGELGATGSSTGGVIVNPIGLSILSPRVVGALGTLQVPVLVLAVVGLWRRGRRAAGLERSRFRVVEYSFAFVGLSIAAGVAMYSWLPEVLQPYAFVPAVLSFISIGFAFAVAVLRLGLYGIDAVVSRTITYAVVVGIVGGSYGLGVVAFAALLGERGDVAVAASTLLAAAAFAPVRSRVQAIVDRRFNRARFDAVRELDGFTQRVRTLVDLESVTDDLARVVVDTLAPDSAALWVRGVDA